MALITEDRLQLHTESGPPLVIAASGELDFENCDELAKLIHENLNGHVGAIDLSLDGMSFVDSSGLRVLIVAAMDARAAGCTLRIINLTAQLDRILNLAGVVHLFDISSLEGPLDRERTCGGSPAISTFDIPAEVESCCEGRDRVCSFAQTHGFHPPVLDDIRLAAGEAFSNAVRHGQCKGCRVAVRCTEIAGGISFTLEYASAIFDPDKVPVPDMDGFPIGGMGIHFMRLVMDSVHYEFRDGNAILTLEKLRPVE